MLWTLHNGSSSPHARIIWVFLSNLYYENLISPLEVISQNYGGHHDGVPLEFLTLVIVHSEPPAICQFQVRFSQLSTGSCRVSACESLHWQDICLSVSNLGGTSLPYVLPSFMDPRRVIYFSVCSGFRLVGQSENSVLLTYATGKMWV